MKFVKGQSGNPSGRPKGSLNMTSELQKVLRLKLPNGQRNVELVARRLVLMAQQGDLDAIQYIFDRIDGKATERTQVSGAQIIRVVYEERPLLAARAVTLLDEGEPGTEIDADDDADAHDDD